MEILCHPSPALQQGAQDVEPGTDKELPRLVATMAKAMYGAPGVGLAAPQLGVLKRVIVLDVEDELVALCNPRLVDHSDQCALGEEGCLSLPGIVVPVERSLSVTCEALDLKGKAVRIEADELLARVLQHEVDHLDGILIIDRATPEARKQALRQYRETLEARS